MSQAIELRGVRVHNLKAIDLDVPHRQLVVFCGVSGSGKTSLALDTLYAEGQRRYIESFSAYTRQFLERLDKPDADRIDNIPPAIAVERKDVAKSGRATIASATETADYLRLLLARIGRVICAGCGAEVRKDSPQNVAERLQDFPAGTRLLVTFPATAGEGESAADIADRLRAEGFVRVVAEGRTIHLADPISVSPCLRGENNWHVVVDRLTVDPAGAARLRESLETAFGHGGGRCVVLLAAELPAGWPPLPRSAIDGQSWLRIGLSDSLRCEACERTYPPLEPRLFDANHALGACLTCEGSGEVIAIDRNRIVPEPGKTIRGGAIAPWASPAYAAELQTLLAAAGELGVPVDVPFQQLAEDQVRLLFEGEPSRGFRGLNFFFQSLEQQNQTASLRNFLARWRSPMPCPACGGKRLRPEALAAKLGGKDLAEILQLRIDDARRFLQSLEFTPAESAVARSILPQVLARLQYLEAVGLGFLTLDRKLRTLSGGEAQRVALTTSLGSSLVNMLYVLDEPTAGLHPRDVERLAQAIIALRDRGNTVVVVEHEETMIRRADAVVEFGPGAGERGGTIVFRGSPQDLLADEKSLTGAYLSGRRGSAVPERRRPANRGRIRLVGARGHNLKNVTVEFPLGLLCLVTGPSGAGKSTLLQDTLYGALCRRKHQDCDPPLAYDDVFGDGQLDEVVLIDQSPIGRSPRSNPVTYVKAFDEIRAVFADTIEARTHNYTAGHFSFNVAGGRCEACQGDGHIEIDMQFLADVFMRCSQCHGTRYRKEILAVTYRGRNIADVLEMTVREAFAFFRGQAKVQTRLKQIIDVGLDYLRLGQPANTLSSGEAQRLKLAAYLSGAGRSRTLFLLDEPTTGLHFADVVQLLDCFDALLAVGHSLIVVEHNLQLMKSADYLIDLGPGAAEDGGRIVATGTPEEIAANPDSITGRYLAKLLAQPSA